jgi:hypothetical protein
MTFWKTCSAAKMGITAAAVSICLVIGHPLLAAPTTIAPPVAHVPAVKPTHTPSLITRNPHLHGVSSTPETAKKTVKKDDKKIRDDHRVWHRRWDYHSWMVIHRGLGTIRGFVHAAEGEGLQGIRLALRHPGGRYFSRVSMRHITYSSAGGNFVMVGVRAGKYRIIASRAKLHGHSQIAVHPGSVSNVGIRV